STPLSPSTSGRPAIQVRSEITPARADADSTYFQSTCPSAAAVPIPATAVCATVLTARAPAFLSHSSQYALFFMSKPPVFMWSLYHFMHKNKTGSRPCLVWLFFKACYVLFSV